MILNGVNCRLESAQIGALKRLTFLLSFSISFFLSVTRHLEIGNFLVYDRLNYELAIIVALKGIAFSSFLAYLIIY